MSEIRRPENGKNGLADRMVTNVYSSEDNKSLHKSLNGEFILYQTLLKQILEGKNLSVIDISSLLKYFQPEDKTTMKEFDTTYNPNKAIHQYTRETCIHKILNKALRTQNIEDITTFGPFIKDLTIQLT